MSTDALTASGPRSAGADPQGPSRMARVAGVALRLSASRETAMVLVGLFVLAVAAQVVFPQRATTTAMTYALWRAQYPLLARTAETLGLDRVASMPWFWALGVALAFSLTVCTLRRAVRLARHGPHPSGATTDLVIDGPVSRDSMVSALVASGYRVVSQGPGEIAARKGMLGPLGSLAFHSGMIILIAGVTVSALTAFSGFAELAPGQAALGGDGYIRRQGPLARGASEVQLAVSNIDVAFWPDGTPKDIRANLDLRAPDGAVARGVAERTNAVRLGSTTATLGSPFGPAALLRFTPEGGAPTAQGYVNFPGGKAPQATRFPMGDTGLNMDAELAGDWRAALEGRAADVQLQLHVPGDAGSARTVPFGGTAAVPGGTIEFVTLEPWALFLVRRDGGLPIAVIGGVIAVAGLAVALLIMPRSVRGEERDGGWRLTARSHASAMGMARELRSVSARARGEG